MDLPAYAHPFWVVRRWRRRAAFWQYTHYITGIAGILIASMIGAGLIGDAAAVKKAGFIAATMAAIMTFLKPKLKAESFVRALRHVRASHQKLDKAVDEAKDAERSPTVKKALLEAERAISAAENQYFKELI